MLLSCGWLSCCPPRWSAPQPSSHHCGGQHPLHNLAALIRGHVAQTNNSVARPRTGEAHIKNLGLNREYVARSHRIGPAQLVHAQSDCALGAVQCLHKQCHCHRRGVPTAGDKSFKNRSLRTLAAKMKHLWIKLVGEFDKPLLRYSQRLRFEPVPHLQIIKITRFHNENAGAHSCAIADAEQCISKCSRT